MPKKGYKHLDKNVVCEHCDSLVSALVMNRAWMLAQLLETSGMLIIDDIEEEMELSRELVSQALRMFRTHLAGLVGKAIVCTHVGGQWVYTLTDEWQNDEGADVENYEQLLTKRLGTEVAHARNAALVAHAKIDGRKRRLKADVADLASTLTSVEERIRFMRERILIIDEELEDAS